MDETTLATAPAGASNSSHATPGPLAERARIRSLDVLRGVALLGILVMNIQSYAMPGVAYMNPTAYGDLSGWNGAVWAGSHLFFDQKMITIFTMLFGAGLLVFASTKSDPVVARRLHRRRMLWLMLFGLLHAHLFWYGDILYTYALVGLIAFRSRDRGPRWLIVKGTLIVAVASMIFLFIGWSMRYWPPEAIGRFVSNSWQPQADVLAHEIDAYRGGWLSQMPTRSLTALMFETMMVLMFALWRVWGVMLVGMALFKLKVLDASLPSRTYRRLAAVGFGLGLPIVALGLWLNVRNGWRAEFSFGYGSQFNYWGSLFVALGWIAVVMLVVRSGDLAGLTGRLAAVGRTAFTNYIAQTIICTSIFYGHGFGLFGRVDRAGQLGIVVAIWIVQLAVSPMWLRRYQYGPLEWLWRSLTYRSRLPMIRPAPAVTV
jgi:uncharacterized protein